jgi:hypothetical protein
MAEKPKEPTIDKRDIQTRLGSPGGGFPEPVQDKVTEAVEVLVEAINETAVQEGGRRS